MTSAYSDADAARPGAAEPRAAWAGGDFEGNRGLLLLRGALAVLFGLLALLAPGAALFALLLTFAAYMAIDGALAILKAMRAIRAGRGWGWFLLEGLAGFAAAAAILLWPGLSLLVIMLLIAAWAIVSGAAMAFAALRGRAAARIWVGLGGAASIVFGVLVAIAPLIGALVVTWWIAAYALIFGVMMLAAGFTRPRRATGGR